MPRMLAQAVHYPKPDHRDDLIASMHRLRAASADLDGLEEIGGFEDAERGIIVAISVWSSVDSMRAGLPVLGAAIADVPFAEWEREAHQMVTMPQVA
jgi:hypothetical protein